MFFKITYKTIIFLLISAIILLGIATYFYITKIHNNKTEIVVSNKQTGINSIPTYTPTPTPEYATVLTNEINDNKYMPITSSAFWESDLKDEIINTVSNGPRYARRAKVEKKFEGDVLAVKFDDGQSYSLLVKNELKVGAPVYTYNSDKSEISGYKVKVMNVSALNYLSPDSIIVVWFYEKSFQTENKSITPYELLIADIK